MLQVALALQKQFSSELDGLSSLSRSTSLSRVSSRDDRDAARALALRKSTSPIAKRKHAFHVSYDRDFVASDCMTREAERESSVVAETLAMKPPTTKGWTPVGLVALGQRMQHIPRVSAVKDYDRLDEIIKEYEQTGVPLIIEDWHKTPVWPQDGLFGVEWLLEHAEEKIAVRDCVTCKDKAIPFKEFIEKSKTISEYTVEGEGERLYGKDAVCPKEWREWLMQSNLPDVLKPGSSDDVLEILPEPERVETLMCYYGIGDTFTAAHKDLCASSGHNLMCFTERGGSAFWFMTHSADAVRAAMYFQTKLGSDLDREARVATPEEFAKAPFTVYLAEQRVGDLVLVPRRSCHQVVNHGGITAKMSWSRMTVDGLCTAFHHELPMYRRVCRSETYRVKLLVYRALLRYLQGLEIEQEPLRSSIADAKPQQEGTKDGTIAELPVILPFSTPSSPLTPTSQLSDEEETREPPQLAPQHEKLLANVRTLLGIFEKIMKEEHQGATQCEMRIRRANSSNVCTTSSSERAASDGGIPPIPIPMDLYHDGLVCDFCGADIFQSFFECRRCVNSTSPEDNIIVCPGCYVEGRACNCSIMTPVQQFPMDVLFDAQNRAQKLLSFERYGKNVVRPIALSHQNIDEVVKHPGLFAAACQLLQVRGVVRPKQPTLACGESNEVPHRVPAAGALTCKKCHRARCFRHRLSSGIHVADALKTCLLDNTHLLWHEEHKTGAKRMKDGKPDVIKAEETGGPCDMSLSLVMHAERFTSCRPMNDKVKPGWYDDAMYEDFDGETAYDSGIEGFSGDFLGLDEDDESNDDGTIEIGSDGPSSRWPRPQKTPQIWIKITKESMQTIPQRRAGSHKPREFPYVLVDELSTKEKEKYLLKRTQHPLQTAPVASSSKHILPSPARPNCVMVRRHKGSPKKPPGEPANVMKSPENRVAVRRPKGSPRRPPGIPAKLNRTRSPIIMDQTSEESSSSDDGSLYRPNGRSSNLKANSLPKRKSIASGTKASTSVSTNVVRKARAQSMRSQSLGSLQEFSREANATHERTGAFAVEEAPDMAITSLPINDDSMGDSSPDPLSIPQRVDVIDTDIHSSSVFPPIDEIVRRLEKSEQKCDQLEEENRKLRAEVARLEEAKADRREVEQLKAEVARLNTVIDRMWQEQHQYRQQDAVTPTKCTSLPASHNVYHKRPSIPTPLKNIAQRAFNDRRAVIPNTCTPSKPEKPISGLTAMRRVPPPRERSRRSYDAEPLADNMSSSPGSEALAIQALKNNRKRKGVDLYSTPVRNERPEDDDLDGTPTNTEPRSESVSTPVTPTTRPKLRMSKPIKLYGPKRRKRFSDETPPSSVQVPVTPQQMGLGEASDVHEESEDEDEDDFLLPGAARTPVTSQTRI